MAFDENLDISKLIATFPSHVSKLSFSEVKMKRRELEANLTSIRIELSANERSKSEAEHWREDIAKAAEEMTKEKISSEEAYIMLESRIVELLNEKVSTFNSK